MATPSRLVSRTARQISILGFCIVLCLGAVLLFVNRTESHRYSARNEALDGAVVDGITKATRSATKVSNASRIVIVPHHLVASEAIARGIGVLARTSDVERVVLISPDHYGKCPTVACTTYGSFETFFGTVDIDSHSVQMLGRQKLFERSSLFANEHGIYSIVPFIKHYLPNAKVIPIVVSVKGTESADVRIELARVLAEFLDDPRTVLVTSTDFSHYLPFEESELMDIDTQSALCAGRLEYIRHLKNSEQSDCPLCLWLTTTLSASIGTQYPTIFWHSNSAELLKDLTVSETTSHFGISYSAEESLTSCPRTEW